MVKIKWYVVDDISDVSVGEFDHEWDGYLDGHFLLTVNQNEAGFYSQELIDANYPDGEDNVLYWFNKLAEGIRELKKGNIFRFHLMFSANLCDLVMEKQNTKIKIMEILAHDSGVNTFRILWEETVDFKEFEDEVYRSGNELLSWICDKNENLVMSCDVHSLFLFLLGIEIERKQEQEENESGTVILTDPLKKHIPARFAQQMKYKNKTDILEQLSYISFFNKTWSEEKVAAALNLGRKYALSAKQMTGEYRYNIFGNDMVIQLERGNLKNGYGLHQYSYQELSELVTM